MPFENGAWQAEADQECSVNLSHGFRGEGSVDGSETLLINGANLIAERVAVFGGAAIAFFHRHVDG